MARNQPHRQPRAGRGHLGLIICAAWLMARPAQANPEVPLLYDARATAMGGTGVAYLRSPAAATHNPALLASVPDVAITATFTPYVLKLSAPFKFNRGAKQVESGAIFGPFAQIALAAPLHERVVVGIGAYLTSAAGGQYDNIPLQSLSASVPLQALVGNARIGTFAGELQLPVAVKVSPAVTLGVAYRITYARAFADISDTLHQPLSHADLSGTQFAGFQLGFLARVHPQVDVGLSYRNNVSLTMHGTMTRPSRKLGTSVTQLPPQPYVSPHQGRLGATYLLLAHRLRLAADARFWLFHAVDPALQNAWSAQLGAEYQMLPQLAARLGYSLGSSATTAASAIPVGPPPGLGHGITCGAGTTVGRFAFDAAVGAIINVSHVRQADIRLPQSAPGRYAACGFLASVSIGYQV